MTAHSLPRTPGYPAWLQGALAGLGAAVLGMVALLAVGAVSGRGPSVLTSVGMGPWPSAVRTMTGASPAASYVLSHTMLYVIAGIVALAIARLADRIPVLLTGLLLVILVIEFSFLVVMTGWQSLGHFDSVTWRAVLIAHAVANVFLLGGIARVHPSLRQAFRRAYED